MVNVAVRARVNTVSDFKFLVIFRYVCAMHGCLDIDIEFLNFFLW